MIFSTLFQDISKARRQYVLYIIEDLKLVEVDIRYQGYCLISCYLGDMDPQSAGSIYRAENDIYIKPDYYNNIYEAQRSIKIL